MQGNEKRTSFEDDKEDDNEKEQEMKKPEHEMLRLF